MKLCKDCKHFQKRGHPWYTEYCHRPLGRYSLVDGVEYTIYDDAFNERAPGKCGKEAKYFVKKIGWFRRLLGEKYDV